jgi:hypothetical protein
MGTVVGPPLARAMQTAFGADQVAVQGVNYPASIAGAVSGALNPKAAEGSQNMAMFAQQLATSCPQSKVVLAGYSQVSCFVLRAKCPKENGMLTWWLEKGAEQVRGALMNLPAQNNVMVRSPAQDMSSTATCAHLFPLIQRRSRRHANLIPPPRLLSPSVTPYKTPNSRTSQLLTPRSTAIETIQSARACLSLRRAI